MEYGVQEWLNLCFGHFNSILVDIYFKYSKNA